MALACRGEVARPIIAGRPNTEAVARNRSQKSRPAVGPAKLEEATPQGRGKGAYLRQVQGTHCIFGNKTRSVATSVRPVLRWVAPASRCLSLHTDLQPPGPRFQGIVCGAWGDSHHASAGVGGWPCTTSVRGPPIVGPAASSASPGRSMEPGWRTIIDSFVLPTRRRRAAWAPTPTPSPPVPDLLEVGGEVGDRPGAVAEDVLKWVHQRTLSAPR